MNVTDLWRYPVKSAAGERLSSTFVAERGIPGDRAWAVRDDTEGDVTWAGDHPALMRIQAATLPDGKVWLASASGAAAFTEQAGQKLLSDAAESPLSLMEHQPHWPEQAIHLLSTASLRSLARALPETEIEVTRFRPNILVDVDAEGFPEHEWIGRRVRAGGVVLRVTVGCVRCVMINQQTLKSSLDKRVLQWVARNLRNIFGVYAAVETPGPVAVGDEVSLLD